MGMLSKAITVGDIELTQFLSFGATKSTKVFIVDSIIYKYIFNNKVKIINYKIYIFRRRTLKILMNDHRS